MRASVKVRAAAKATNAIAPNATASRIIYYIHSNWWTGEDSNLRRSKDRQIYSLLPLTARPPVLNKSNPSVNSRLRGKPLRAHK